MCGMVLRTGQCREMFYFMAIEVFCLLEIINYNVSKLKYQNDTLIQKLLKIHKVIISILNPFGIKLQHYRVQYLKNRGCTFDKSRTYIIELLFSYNFLINHKCKRY